MERVEGGGKRVEGEWRLEVQVEPDPVLESNSKNEGFGKEWPKLELLSGSTRIALMEPSRFLNREDPNRRGTDTTRTCDVLFYFFETKRTQTNREIPEGSQFGL